MPFCDIAAATGISTEAAKKRAQRGLKRLREKITESAKVKVKSVKLRNPEKTSG
jgi:DNA-directed RNA polymerase specialized sigma24 family protein